MSLLLSISVSRFDELVLSVLWLAESTWCCLGVGLAQSWQVRSTPRARSDNLGISRLAGSLKSFWRCLGTRPRSRYHSFLPPGSPMQDFLRT